MRQRQRILVACASANWILAFSLGCILADASSAKRATAQHRMSVGVGAGVGSLYSEDQLGYLNYLGVGGGLTANISYPVLGPLAVDGRLSLLGYVSQEPWGSLAEAGLGVRVQAQPLAGPIGIGAAVHGNLAQTGQHTRPSADASLRIEYEVTESGSVGPELTLGRVFQTATGPEASTDADYWLVSLVFVHRPPAEPKPLPVAAVAAPRRPPRRHPPTNLPPTPPSAELTELLDQVVTRRVEARLFSPVLFRFDSTELIACGEASLYQALDIIQQKGETVVIEGHADSVGDDDYNRALSRKRADFVYRWLVRHGVPPRRLRVAARGEQQPLVPEPENAGDSDNDIDPAVAPQGRLQLNRRVTFRIAREEGPIPEDEGSVDAVPLEVAGPAEATP